MRALLIRHATSSHQAPDAPLTPEGFAQAKALVPVLEKLGAGPLYASPYLRAQQTISPFSRASGQTVTTLADLKERRLAAQDLPDWQDHVRRSFGDANHAAPGGESHAKLRTRAARALVEIEQAGGNLPAFVTHGGLIAALFSAHVPGFNFMDWRNLRNPDLFLVRNDAGRIVDFQRLDLEMHT